MNWIARIQREKNESEKLYGSFDKRPIKLYPIIEDKKYIFSKNNNYKNCFTKELIEKILKIILKSNCIHYRYNYIVPNYGYGIPDYEHILKLSNKITELEITEMLSLGCGCGFFDLLLNNINKNIKIESSDIVPPDTRHVPMFNYSAIEHIENTSLKEYVLLIVWPPKEQWVPEIIKKYKETKIKNKIVILVGSIYQDGGCWTEQLEEELENSNQLYSSYYKNFDETEYLTIYQCV